MVYARDEDSILDHTYYKQIFSDFYYKDFRLVGLNDKMCVCVFFLAPFNLQIIRILLSKKNQK